MKIKRLSPLAILPTRGTPDAAGLDLHYYGHGVLVIHPGRRQLAPTGIAMAIPQGCWGEIKPRSGLALRQGIDVMAGVIDCDYRGEIHALLLNTGTEPVEIHPNNRIAQIVIQSYENPICEEVDELDETPRGENGYGSTGK